MVKILKLTMFPKSGWNRTPTCFSISFISTSKSAKCTSWNENGWKNERMKGWKDKRMKGWKNKKMKEWKNESMKGWKKEKLKGWKDKRMKGYKD